MLESLASLKAIVSADAIAPADKLLIFNATVAAPPSADPFVIVVPPFVAFANDST